MSNFKTYLIKKNQETLKSLSFDRNAFFRYKESETINEMISSLTHRIKKNKIRDALVESSVAFESIDYFNDSESNHEDLIETGYLLGLLHATHKGCIYSVEFERIRFYYIGMESDIIMDLRNCFRSITK